MAERTAEEQQPPSMDPYAEQQQQQHQEGRPLHFIVEQLIRSHWYQALILLGLAYVAYLYFRDRFDEWRARPKNINNPERLQSLEERRNAARKRQQAWSNISSAEDAEKKREKEHRDLEEKKKKEDEIQQRAKEAQDGGHVLGSAEASSSAPYDGTSAMVRAARAKPIAKKKAATAAPAASAGAKAPQPKRAPNYLKDSDDDESGPRKKLPKLSGGSKQDYESFPGATPDSESGGARRFGRNCGPKGG